MLTFSLTLFRAPSHSFTLHLTRSRSLVLTLVFLAQAMALDMATIKSGSGLVETLLSVPKTDVDSPVVRASHAPPPKAACRMSPHAQKLECFPESSLHFVGYS